MRDNTGVMNTTDVFNIMDNHVTTDMWRTCSDEARIATVDIAPLTVNPLTVQHATVSGGWVGPNSGEYIPQVAAIVKLLTTVGGRRHRGRVFLPFTREGIVSAGALTGATAATVEGAWLAFMNDCQADDLYLCVASYVASSSQDVSNILCEAQTGTQRRRQSRNR
jgi:hypothetical protein